MHGYRETLELSLKSQVLQEVQHGLSVIQGGARISAAHQIVEFLCLRKDEDFVELSVHFIESLIRYMIVYVNKLVIDRVVCITNKTEGETPCSDLRTEISVCDKLLRSLRQLQTDMTNRISINEGTYKPPDIMNRSNKLPSGRIDQSVAHHVDKIVERSILTRSCGSGYHMAQGVSQVPNTGNLIRERARLIAYLFLCSQQLDSFFIGIDLLRQTGQHVAKVLTSIFINTSIKFVRDRIWHHLSHKQSSHSSLWDIVPLLRQFEELYPINCFDTQLNRRWSVIEGFVVGEGVAENGTSSSVPQIECGNIPDVSVNLLGDHHANIGNIGNLSLDESNNILRCMHCSSETMRHEYISRAGSDGYMHLTVSWLKRMNEKDIKMVFMERATDYSTSRITTEDQFGFYAKKHDWYSVLQLLEKNPNFFIRRTESSIVKAIDEKLFLRCPDHSGATPQMLATVGLLLSGDSTSTVVTNCHDGNLEWIMSEASGMPPQVLPLYLRRYGLWDDDVRSSKLLQVENHKIQLYGRLGIGKLPQVSRLMTAAGNYDEDLIRLCEYMFEGVSDVSVIDWICTTFPNLEQFLKSPLLPPEMRFEDSIYDLKTQMGDVSIKDLLTDVYPDWDKRLRQHDGRRDHHNHAQPESQMLSLEYLLAQGRPCGAFLLCEKIELQKSARRVAFYNLFDDGVVACAIAFLDLNGESTETLRVDIQSARSILGFNYTRQGRDEVVEVFLSFEHGRQSENLLRALKMLEESAWVQEPPTGEVAQAGESPWHLVALFCRVHNLPRSLTLLHELARNGDWVMFLHESDLQQCPIDTVRDVVRLYFVDNPLRNHLNILLGGREREDSQLQSFPSREVGSSETGAVSPANQLVKFLALYQFERARGCVEGTVAGVDQEEVLTVLHSWKTNGSFLLESEINNLTRIASIGMNDFSSSSLSTPVESVDEDIGSLDASSFKGTLRGSSSSSGVMVESLLTDDEDEAQLFESIRQALSEGADDESVRDKVTGEELFRQTYSLIVNHLSRGGVVSEGGFLGLVRIVSLEARERFGHFLLGRLEADDGTVPELESLGVRRDVCILAHYAMTTSFSDSGLDGLSKYIASDDRLGTVRDQIGMHIPEIRWGCYGNTSDVTNAAHKLIEMSSKKILGKSKVSLIDLHGLTKVAEVYKAQGMLRRHLATTDLIRSVSSRLKSTVLD